METGYEGYDQNNGGAQKDLEKMFGSEQEEQSYLSGQIPKLEKEFEGLSHIDAAQLTDLDMERMVDIETDLPALKERKELLDRKSGNIQDLGDID